MKLAIMQPYLFPYIGYFQLINAADKFVVYDDVSFIKQGWINRNRILAGDKPLMFSVPLENQSSFRTIRETNIDLRQYQKWQTKFFRSLTENYKKAAFFEVAYPLIKDIFEFESISIVEVAKRSLYSVCNYLQIKTPFVETSGFYKNSDLKGESRVIDICNCEKARQYINVFGGVELYDKKNFADQGIELSFIKSHPIIYRQFNANFVSSLSIIDVLMFNSVEEVRKMLTQYELI